MWVVFIDPDTHRADVDLDVFAPDAPFISSHIDINDARAARDAHRERQEREAAEARGQRDLFG